MQQVDKLKLYTTHKTAIPRHIFHEDFACTGTKNIKGGMTVYHYLNNEGVKVNDMPNGISIEFNPTKYTKGNNYEMIDRNGLSSFTQMINEKYQTDFSLWDVSLFDYNSNIYLTYPPKMYLQHFGGLKNWNVKEYTNTGINYNTKSNTKAVTIYDLNERCKEKKEPMPDNTHPHILRVELSINKQANKQKELKDMKTLNDYLQPKNYSKIPALWLKHYEQIAKNETVNYIPYLSKKEADMIAAIQLHTLNGYKTKLKIEYPKTYRYHFKQIESLLQKVREHKTNYTLTDELNQKVRDRAKQLIEESYPQCRHMDMC